MLFFRDLAGIQNNEDTSISMLLVDTAGCDLVELNLPDEVSKANEGLIENLIHKL